jgi:hypothetical protein
MVRGSDGPPAAPPASPHRVSRQPDAPVRGREEEAYQGRLRLRSDIIRSRGRLIVRRLPTELPRKDKMIKYMSVLLFIGALTWPAGAVQGQDDKDTRRDLETQYRKLAEAHDRKDLKAIVGLKTSDFHAIFPDGRIGDSKLMEEYSRGFLGHNQPPFNMRFTIKQLSVSYNKLIAVAEILQEVTRYQDLAGKRRKVETSVMQREIWARTPDGWRLKSGDNVRDQRKAVDGKRVDPSKPYNPDDPPYRSD